MTAQPDTPFLAIDGGGTRCRFALCDPEGRTVIEGGPANAFSDFEGSVACIRDGLDRLAHASATPRETLFRRPAVVGLAGVVTAEIARNLQQALPLTRARYVEDRLAALHGALGQRNGFVAHCGTGSFLAAQTDGAARFAGGWGAAMGDEASAFWVARAAFAAALRHTDGLCAGAPLLDQILTKYDGPAGILTFMRVSTPGDVAQMAPLVTRHAQAGDTVARGILQGAADYISGGLRKMGWHAGMPICLTGGIGPQYGAWMPPDMQADLADPLGDPLDGAIALARAFSQEVAHG